MNAMLFICARLEHHYELLAEVTGQSILFAGFIVGAAAVALASRRRP